MPAASRSSFGVGGVSGILASSHIVKRDATLNLHGIAKEFFCWPSHNVEMAKHGKNHLRAWREFRELTQEDLAEAVGTTGSVISMIESGSRGLSDKWLRKLAPALGTTPGYLLDHDPNDLPTDIIDIWTSIPDRDKPTALRILEGFKTGTKD